VTNYKNDFSLYIYSTNIVGSNKAKSYIKALDWLSKVLQAVPLGFDDCKNIWTVNSIDRLQELYLFVLQEARKKDASQWNMKDIPKSYLQKGYCSAAIRSYQDFLVGQNYEEDLIEIFKNHKGDEPDIVKKLKKEIVVPSFLKEDLKNIQGKEYMRSVRVRANQNVFRKMILHIYNQTCCITGLNIPEINIASHIIPWTVDETIRLDPANGLCLSATYDSAFDKCLISLDDDYRLIISKNIKDYYKNENVKEYFISQEGRKIAMPIAYLPKKEYIQRHRSNGEF